MAYPSLNPRFADGVVELADRGGGVDPRPVLAVGGDGVEVGQVHHRDRLRPLRPVRQALVVVPAAAHAEADAVGAATPDGGLHVGGICHGDDANCGVGLLANKNLEFRMVDTSTPVKLREPGVKMSSLGIFSVRH